MATPFPYWCVEGVKFYTKVKTITARWPEGQGGAVDDSAFVIPTMN